MATWTITLPDTAVEGETTHIEDHNALTEAIAEARSFIDAAEAALASIDAGAITSGTLAAARIPTLSFSKVTGLQSALDGKADDADLASKADTTVTDDLESRVAALEAAAV